MELWKAQREYRVLAMRLRKGTPAPEVLHAEEAVLVTLGTGQRLMTELSVLRAAMRSAGARIRRLRAALANSGLKQCLGRVLEPSALSESLAAHGFHELAAFVSSAEHELRHFERRVNDVQARLSRQESVVETALSRLRQLFTLHTNATP